MTLFLFLIQVFVISLSGALSPGPVTAAAIATGQRSRHAGALLAVGHGILEFPLMILIMLGMGKLLKLSYTQIAIGLAGGIVLLIMAIQMLAGSNTDKNTQGKISTDKPILTGFILSASNPYFLLWWATVGLALATTARQLGIWAFALFTITHWLCDLVWLEKLAPEKPYSQYKHNGYEDNADAHLKRTIMGREVVVAVTEGKLDFGPWEQIFYGEFDGKRKKRVLVKIIGE